MHLLLLVQSIIDLWVISFDKKLSNYFPPLWRFWPNLVNWFELREEIAKNRWAEFDKSGLAKINNLLSFQGLAASVSFLRQLGAPARRSLIIRRCPTIH